MDQTSMTVVISIAIVFVLLLGSKLLTPAPKAGREPAPQRRAQDVREWNGPPLVETGFITEESRLTAWGAVSLLALIANWIVSGYYALTTATVFQQIEVGIAFLGGNVLWGLGLALGRRRTFRTYRYEAEKPE